MQRFFWDAERIAATARLVLAAALSLALLLGMPRGSPLFPLMGFAFVVYVLYAVAVLRWLREPPTWPVRVALTAGDVAVLITVVLFAPTLPAAFLVFFLYFTLVAGLWQGWQAAAVLSAVVAVAYLGVSWRETAQILGGEGLRRIPWQSWGVAAALLVAGVLMGTLAERERQRLEEHAVTGEFRELLSLDTRWELLWERFLRALCERYHAECVLLAYLDPDSGRVIVWPHRAEAAPGATREEDRPPRDSHTFLLDEGPDCLLGVVSKESVWRWQAGPASGKLEPEESFSLPVRFAREFMPGSLLAVRLLPEGEWSGRIFLLDHRGPGFEPAQAEDLQFLLQGLAPALATLLTIRGQVTKAVDLDRDRIVRELHDSVAQSLASVEMQLSVFRRMASQNPTELADELARLQLAVSREREEFRRFLRDLKPLRVPPHELAQRLVAHCAQFQQETGIEVDVRIDPLRDDLPEGISREVFLILREALHNARKHSGAGQVLVQVRQDEASLSLVVDDNGGGFAFSGVYNHLELKEKALGPAVLWDRLQSLGGTLEIESDPVRGATLRMDIPLS